VPAPERAAVVVPTAVLPAALRTTAALNLRTTSGVSGAVILVIPSGATVRVLGRAATGWYEVSYGGRTGWASDHYLTAASLSLRTTAPLNLRASGSTAGAVLLTMPSGVLVTASSWEDTTNWYRVTYRGTTGWASGYYLAPATSPSPPTTSTAPVISQTRGPNRTRRVVLSFDDCPRSLSAFTAVMHYARDAGIGLVLAPTGNCRRQYQVNHGVDLADYARRNGQWVINHTVTHPDMTRLTCAQGAAELRGWGVWTNMGRPPYGAVNVAVRCAYASRGMAIWTWSRDTRDWESRSKSLTIARAGAALPGDTVLMHMQWYGFSADAIHQVRDRLAARGIGVCRAYRGTDGVGSVVKTPVNLPSSLPC